MQVTQIEVHEIELAYHDWIAYPLNHYYGPAGRTVYIAHTDDGRIGLGESGAPSRRRPLASTSAATPLTGSATRLRWGWARPCTT